MKELIPGLMFSMIPPVPSEETVKAIEAALIHFGMISEDAVPIDEVPIRKATRFVKGNKVTYAQIQDFILEEYGVKVHTSYIAEVKRLHNVGMQSNRRKSNPQNEAKHPTEEKVRMIEAALVHFGIINQDQITK